MLLRYLFSVSTLFGETNETKQYFSVFSCTQTDSVSLFGETNETKQYFSVFSCTQTDSVDQNPIRSLLKAHYFTQYHLTEARLYGNRLLSLPADVTAKTSVSAAERRREREE